MSQGQQNNLNGGSTPSTPVGWWNLFAVSLKLARDPAGRRGLFVTAAVLAIAGALGLVDGTWFAVPEITPVESRFGWNENIAKVEAPVIAARMPAFAVTDEFGQVVSAEGKNSELWKFAKLCNSGQHIPTWKQESGDCVSMGWSNAIAYRQAFQIAKEGGAGQLEIPFPPYMYGISRVQIGKRQLGRVAGSIGAWAAQGSQAYGVATVGHAAEIGVTYSGKLADKYGWEGPPKSLVDKGKLHRVNQVSQVRSWEDARDALGHGYTVTVASNVGFEGGYVDADGKRWLRPGGKWPHQMCLIGMEDRPGRKKGAYCINSWGVDAHPRPLGDEPHGGFWIEAEVIQRMVSQGDSWAYSDFDGFESDELADWNAFREKAVKTGNDAAVVAAEAPETTTVKEVRKMYAKPISCTLLSFAGLILAFVSRVKLGRSTRVAATLMVAFALIGLSTNADAGPRKRNARWTAYQASCAPACDPAVCGCVSCQCPGQQFQQIRGTAREIQIAAAPSASAGIGDASPKAWNALSTVVGSPPIVPASWNALQGVTIATPRPSAELSTAWNALASLQHPTTAVGTVPMQRYRKICTGTGCYLVPE